MDKLVGEPVSQLVLLAVGVALVTVENCFVVRVRGRLCKRRNEGPWISVELLHRVSVDDRGHGRESAAGFGQTLVDRRQLIARWLLG
ncbi:hypothetical protein [Rhodococcus opacus]|uniref:hypothetical protein n=1 Tax=Rhodococcus opacus TaxID=37919 RepID=UPI002952FDE2|nr:hypothetical protein [Rhodococcus opacus]